MPQDNRIILQDGLYSYTPPIAMPRDEKEIWNFDKPKREQVWNTPVIPNLTRMTERERIETIEKWRRWWDEGMYIFIEGEPVYMTGLHFEHLSINTYNSRKLLYFDDERFIFYFIDLTEAAPECEGRCWIKPRRAKMTTIMCSLAQRKLLSDFSNYVTLQSDTLDKAQKSYMQPIIDSYTRRPEWLREKYYAPNGKKPRKSLELISNMVQLDGDEWLGGKINVFPTLAKAADGLEAIESVIDEFSKIEGIDPYELFEVLRKVVQNFRKAGRIDCLSSSGDNKDAVKATMSWHKLIAKSNPLNKDKFGKTQSGLWEYFISAIHSQYVPKEFTNEFGKVNKEMAEEWIWNEIKKYPEGTKEYIYALYKLPLKKEHALLSSAVTTLFHKIRISVRLDELEKLMPDQKPYVRGRLEEDVDGRVYFEEDPAGHWLVAVHPYYSLERGIDTRNRYRKNGVVLNPSVNPEGAIGYDPINYPKSLTTSNHLSQVCIMVHKKFDYFNSGIEDEKMAMCLYRPDDPHEGNKECMKAAKYWGYPVMFERSVSHPYEDFLNASMLGFLLKGDGKIWGLSQSDMKAKQDGVSMLQTRYAVPRPNTDQKDQLACYPFEDGLRSLDNFDINNTTPFDPTMAEIMCEHGLKQIEFTNLTDQSHNNKLSIMKEIFAPYR